jgi:DNA-binding transcriptional LysR family regulator
MNALNPARTGSLVLSGSVGAAPQGVELRHLRYFVAVADAGTFTQAAERMYIAQPTLSQQVRRLEEMVGTLLFRRRREGVRLTEAGMVLLEESRAVLSAIDHGVSRTRQAAGIGRPRLRFAVPPDLPETLTVETASRLRSAAAAADVEVTWMEQPLDAEFSPIRQRRADAGLGWMDPGRDSFPAPLEVMNLGEFEPDVWVPGSHPLAVAPGPRGAGLRELAPAPAARCRVGGGPEFGPGRLRPHPGPGLGRPGTSRTDRRPRRAALVRQSPDSSRRPLKWPRRA